MTALSERSDGVQVRLADGGTVEAGFLVGADGVYSGARSALFGSGERGSALMSEARRRFMAPDPGVDCYTVCLGSGLVVPDHPGGW
jgi:2-polyprenyl-6-methoxyphenol hydroxylase-like FAD-dependent oxidoreductase